VEQDFIAYFPRFGKIEIESSTKRDTSILRTTFGKVFLDDSEFFDSEEAEALIDLERLKDPNFSFELESGHQAALTDVRCRYLGQGMHRIDLNSDDVFQTMDTINIWPILPPTGIRGSEDQNRFPRVEARKDRHAFRPQPDLLQSLHSKHGGLSLPPPLGNPFRPMQLVSNLSFLWSRVACLHDPIFRFRELEKVESDL
jgi:hypothetical protein